MIRVAPWVVNAGDRSFTLRPLTVRERIALSEQLAEEKASEVLRDAKAIEMSHKDAMRAAQEAREEARRSSSLVMHCFNLSGAAMVLAACCDDAEAFLAAVEISDASMHAIAALGVDVDRYREAAAAANPL
jgi:hypothetical protein